MGNRDEKEVTEQEGHDAFCRIVQHLYQRPAEESEEQLRFCLRTRHNPVCSREFMNKPVRDAIHMLRLHRAVLNATPDELRKYGVEV